MGTWGTGPFDSDAAADFAAHLDKASPDERVESVRGVLTRTVAAARHSIEAPAALAAVALVAAQCPGGEPIDPSDGPAQPMPPFPEDFRVLAAQALDRVAADEAGISGSWVDPADAREWLAMVESLRSVLASR